MVSAWGRVEVYFPSVRPDSPEPVCHPPDAVVWVVDAVRVAPEALPRQPTHRRRPRQTVLQPLHRRRRTQERRQQQRQRQAQEGGGRPRCLKKVFSSKEDITDITL